MTVANPIRQIRSGASHKHVSPLVAFAGTGTMFDVRGNPDPISGLVVEAEIGVDYTGARVGESYWIRAPRADGSGRSPHFVLFGERLEEVVRLCAAAVAVGQGGHEASSHAVVAYEGRNETCEVAKDPAGFRMRFYAKKEDGSRGRVTAEITAGFSREGTERLAAAMKELNEFRQEAVGACEAEIAASEPAAEPS